MRNSRQETLIPEALVKEAVVHVIGCGAVGRQVAPSLAAMGVKQIYLYDFDTIGEENLSPQKFPENTLGILKEEVVASECVAMHSQVKVISKGKFKPTKLLRNSYVFSCVDSMATREEIYEACKQHKAKWFGDTRSGAELCEVYSVPNPEDDCMYTSTLFSNSEASRISCSTKMTSYVAGISANMVLAKFAQVLRGFSTKYSQNSFNLLSWELS